MHSCKTNNTHRTHDCCLPLEHVVTGRASRAGRWWVTSEIDQFLYAEASRVSVRSFMLCPATSWYVATIDVRRLSGTFTILYRTRNYDCLRNLPKDKDTRWLKLEKTSALVGKKHVHKDLSMSVEGGLTLYERDDLPW